MDEKAIKTEVRLHAVEWLACAMTALLFTGERQRGGFLTEWRKQAISGARLKTFPEVDPAISDLVRPSLKPP